MEVYFRARGDFQVIHEPFANVYWKGEAANPILNCILDATKSSETPVFIKDIAHHVPKDILCNKAFVEGFEHALVLRAPLAAFHSHLKVNPEVKAHEFGYIALHKTFNYLKQRTGRKPVIMLADQLVLDPEANIKNFCAALDIAHIPEALSWQAKQQEDWSAGEKWQRRAGNSSGFEPNIKKNLPSILRRQVCRCEAFLRWDYQSKTSRDGPCHRLTTK